MDILYLIYYVIVVLTCHKSDLLSNSVVSISEF